MFDKRREYNTKTGSGRRETESTTKRTAWIGFYDFRSRFYCRSPTGGRRRRLSFYYPRRGRRRRRENVWPDHIFDYRDLNLAYNRQPSSPTSSPRPTVYYIHFSPHITDVAHVIYVYVHIDVRTRGDRPTPRHGEKG